MTAKQINYLVVRFLSIYFLTLFGCKGQESCKCESYADISVEMKTLVEFSQGDYWIYKLFQDTSISDKLVCTSFNVLDNSCDESFRSGNATPCTKIYRLKLTHSNATIFPGFTSNSGKPGFEEVQVEQFANRESYTIVRNVQGTLSIGDFFVLPEVNPDSVYSNGAGNYSATLLDSFQVGTTIYRDVIFSRVKGESSDFLFIDSIYFAPKIGIIQYNNGSNQTWKLSTYQIK